MMIGMLKLFGVVLWVGLGSAQAGITDALPPGFSVAPWSVTGVLNNGSIATAVMCTAAGTVTVGVEVFGAPGGVALNSVGTGVNLLVGQTAMFTTGNVSNFAPDVNMLLPNTQGSARVVATSSKVACHAFVVEKAGGYIMANLTVIKKTAQTGD